MSNLNTTAQASSSNIVSLPAIPQTGSTANGIAVHGVVCKQAITNSRWWNEGVSLFNPAHELNCTLNKSEKLLFHLDTQSAEIRAKVQYPVNGRRDKKGYEAALNNFKALVLESLEGMEGKTFKYEDSIYKGFGVELKHRKMNQPLTSKDWSIEDAPFNVGSFYLKLAFSLDVKSAWKKLRGYGVKATLVPWDIFDLQFEGSEDITVVHSMSGLKGKPLDLVAFSHKIGGASVNIRDGVIIPDTGVAAGKAFDLTKPNSVVDQWRNKAAFTTEMRFKYARAAWNFVRACDEASGVVGTPEYDVLKVEDIDQDTVRLTVRVEMLVAEMPLNIEVSLPEEGSGRTQLTPEMQSVMALQNREVGEMMVSKGDLKRKAIVSLLLMMENMAPAEATVLNIQDLSVLNELKVKLNPFSVGLGNQNASLKQYLNFPEVLGLSVLVNELQPALLQLQEAGIGFDNDIEVIKTWSRAFPNGVVLKSKGENASHSQYLNFPAIMGISTFVGGSGDGVSHSICQFLRWLPTQAGVASYQANIHQEWALVCGSLKGWFRKQLESKSLKKKLVSGLKGTALGAKVRTVALPELSHDGTVPNAIPKAGMNPEDDLLWELAKDFSGKVPYRFTRSIEASRFKADNGERVVGYQVKLENGDIDTVRQLDEHMEILEYRVFDPYSLQGEYVSLFRTPMPMQGGCELVITPKVGVGHIALLMHVWAAMNEGDSDGDGIGIVPLFHYYDSLGYGAARRYEVTLAMNTHPMGMAGYAICYGADWSQWPCQEFCSFEDAWAKKKLIIPHGSKLEAKLMEKGILPYIRKVRVTKWISANGNVSGHYKGNVGKSYNLAVIAVNQSLDQQYQVWNGDDSVQSKLDDSLVTCAVCWRLVYEGLGLAGFSHKAKEWFNLLNLSAWGTSWTYGPTGNPTFPSKQTPKTKQYTFPKALAEGLGIGHLATVVGPMLTKFSSLIADAKALENPNNSKGYAKRYQEITASPSRLKEAVIRRVQRLCSQGVDHNLDNLLSTESGENDYNDGADDETPVSSGQSCVSLFVKANMAKELSCSWQGTLLLKAAAFIERSQRLVASAKKAELDSADN